jgi:hypothetical protein
MLTRILYDLWYFHVVLTHCLYFYNRSMCLTQQRSIFHCTLISFLYSHIISSKFISINMPNKRGKQFGLPESRTALPQSQDRLRSGVAGPPLSLGWQRCFKCLIRLTRFVTDRFFYLVCETIGTAATPGLLCQPRVIVKMIVESRWNVDY